MLTTQSLSPLLLSSNWKILVGSPTFLYSLKLHGFLHPVLIKISSVVSRSSPKYLASYCLNNIIRPVLGERKIHFILMGVRAPHACTYSTLGTCLQSMLMNTFATPWFSNVSPKNIIYEVILFLWILFFVVTYGHMKNFRILWQPLLGEKEQDERREKISFC